MLTRKKLKARVDELAEINRKGMEANAELWLKNAELKAKLHDLTELNKLIVESNGELSFKVETLEKLNDELSTKNLELLNEVQALISFNNELARKLERAAEHFGEAFVKGGELPAPKGADRPNRKKLTEQEVKDIRDAHRGGVKQKDLADNYGVNPATISRVVRGIYH